MTEIIETHGHYRLRLEIDTDGNASNPRQDRDTNLTNVITPPQRDYIPIDEDGGPLQYGWDYFRTLFDDEKLFIRWARIYHGVTVIVRRPHGHAWGLWYVMPDKAAETPWPVEKIIETEAGEYECWASGEVYGYVVERSVIWVPAEGQVAPGEEMPEPITTWEHVDSGWGYIGRENAESAAREEFAPYKKD